MIQSLAQRMFDAGVRVETMFWIGGMCAGPTDEFSEFLDDDLGDCEDIIAKFSFLKPYVDGCADAEEFLAEFAMREIDGFFVQLATPTPFDVAEDGKSYSSSWGRYRTKWFFCSNLEDVVSQAEPWQTSIVEQIRAKALA